MSQLILLRDTATKRHENMRRLEFISHIIGFDTTNFYWHACKHKFEDDKSNLRTSSATVANFQLTLA